MIKTLTIDEKPVEINSSAGWLYVYNEQFGHDVLVVIMPIIEAITKMVTKSIKESGIKEGDDWSKLFEGLTEDMIDDTLITLSGLQLTTLTNIVWALAKNADPKLPGPQVWLNSFENFPQDEVVPVALDAVLQSSFSKKNYQKIKTTIQEIRQSQQSESPSPQSTED